MFRARACLALSIAVVTVLCQSVLSSAIAAPSAQSARARHPHRHPRKRHHKKKQIKAIGPSLALVGFGLNQQFIKPNAKVSSDVMCAAIIGSGAPGENIRFTTLVRATAIPPNAPTVMTQTIPWDGGIFSDDPTTATPVPWSGVFGPGTLLVSYPGSTKQIFQTGLSTAFTEGVSGSDVDGEYSVSLSVQVGPHALTAQGSFTVTC